MIWATSKPSCCIAVAGNLACLLEYKGDIQTAKQMQYRAYNGLLKRCEALGLISDDSDEPTLPKGFSAKLEVAPTKIVL